MKNIVMFIFQNVWWSLAVQKACLSFLGLLVVIDVIKWILKKISMI
jgi:hypothetical protein